MGKKIFRSLLIALLITGIAVILIGCSIALPTFDPSKLNIDYKTTTVYDKNNNQVMSFQAVPGEAAKLNEIPKPLQEALVDVEDSRFYTHNGIDFRSIGRAIYRDVLTGSKAEGGSTLTQQLAKNVYLTQDKTFTRKLKEIYLSAQIERNYSKEDILEMYFNRIYFGHGAMGIKLAAETYFDKGDHLKDLTLGECALLAGLPNAPSAYDPWNTENQKAAIERRNVVLDAMYANGHITAEQRDAAKKEKLNLVAGHDIKGTDQSQYPYYLDYILEEAENKLNIPAEQILRGGVSVYTNLDPQLQGTLEKLYQDPNNFPKNAADGTWAQGASVVVDPKTGGILALVGGRDKDNNHTFRGLNRVSDSKLLPGSSFKPVVDYAPAIDLGIINSNSSLPNRLDKPFPGGYNPRNWNNQYSASVPVSEAIAQSLNVPAASLLYQMGIDKGYKYVTENFGIPLDKQYENQLGIALGAVDVRPLDLAGAYTAFANNGVRTTPHAINKVVNEAGDTIGELDTETHKAIEPDTAKVMTKLLQGVVDHGTGTAARVPGRQVAGKTGTLEFDSNSSGNRTAFFAGYTPGYVMVNWMGFDNTDETHYLRQGSELPAAMFAKEMSQGLKGVPAGSFDTNVTEKPVKDPNADKKTDDAAQNIVKDLSASLNGSTGRITWSPVPMDGIEYYVYRAERMADGTAANSARISVQKGTGYTDTHLEPGKTYLYNVVVAKDNKDVSMSNFASLTVPGQANQTPSQPTTPDQPGTTTPTAPTQPNSPTDGTTTNPGSPTTQNPTTPSQGGNQGGGTQGQGGQGTTTQSGGGGTTTQPSTPGPGGANGGSGGVSPTVPPAQQSGGTQ